MGNFDDFDLDLKQIKNNGPDIRTAATAGVVCTYIITKSVDYSISKVVESYKECTQNDCRVPSRDYDHPSCRRMNAGTVQINC